MEMGVGAGGMSSLRVPRGQVLRMAGKIFLFSVRVEGIIVELHVLWDEKEGRTSGTSMRTRDTVGAL